MIPEEIWGVSEILISLEDARVSLEARDTRVGISLTITGVELGDHVKISAARLDAD